jgi:hypothetical protein
MGGWYEPDVGLSPIGHFLLIGLIVPFATRKRADQSSGIQSINQRPDAGFDVIHGRIVQD